MPPPRKTIAIVDDDASLRKALDRQLSASGFNCVTFASAEEFLLVAAVVLPACVLADIHLEGMSGLQLALHPQLTALNVPVVLITGDALGADFGDVSRELSLPVFEKPLDIGALRGQVRRFLEAA